MPMLARHLKTLEYDKVLDLLRRHTSFVVTDELVADLIPSPDASQVSHDQEVTEEARRVLEARPNAGVRGARDIRTHVRRATIGGVLHATELLDVAATVGAGRGLRNLLARQEIRTPNLARIARGIAELDDLEQTIRTAIDDEGRVLDSASDRLHGIRVDLRTSYDRLMKRLNDMIATTSIREALQDAIVTQRSGRYVLPVKSEFRSRVRGI